MTDFLTSLTARSFGTETGIRPRVASLFEPVRRGDASLLEALMAEPREMAVSSEVEVESGGEQKMSPPQLKLRRDGDATDAKQAANEDPVSVMAIKPRDDSARHRTSATVRSDEGWTVDDTTASPRVRPRKALLSPKERPLESNLSASLRPALEDGTRKRLAARAAAASTIGDESFQKDNRGLARSPWAVTEITAQMKSAAMAMNVGSNARAREIRNVSPAMAAASEPSVQVTIGTIEVRAIPESKPLGRSRGASPVMSLEEYLHRRTQRGDR